MQLMFFAKEKRIQLHKFNNNFEWLNLLNTIFKFIICFKSIFREKTIKLIVVL